MYGWRVISNEILRRGLAHPLSDASPDALGLGAADAPGRFYAGKVRDNYVFAAPEGQRRLLVTTDRLSAFDRIITTLPFKGQVLNQLAAYWFQETRAICKNHMIEVRDPNAILAEECTPLPVEMVVRAYLTGVTSTSVWTAYARGDRTFCGHALPDGLSKNDPLPMAIVTPSTKAEKGGHDVSMSRAEILARGEVSPEHFDRAAALALELFAFGTKVLAERGLILVDTKYELGLDRHGDVVLIDEIHTPDSSRIWFRDGYEDRRARGEEPESFDKEYVRRHLASAGFGGDGPIPDLPDEVRIEAARRYVEAYERIVGRPFEPALSEPGPRLRDVVRDVAKGASK